MIFYFEKQNTEQLGVTLYQDNSFGITKNVFWDFQVLIEGPILLLLNFIYSTKTCIGMEGYFDIKKCKKRDIHFHVKEKGILKVDSFPIEQDRYGISYRLNCCKFFFDYQTNIYAVGELNTLNEVYEIAQGQYVGLEGGRITLLLIQF